jgi:hypothetical protein
MEEGRTHMMHQHYKLAVVPALLAVALLAAACQDLPTTARRLARPNFWAGGGCTPGKFTGGGRIDPPNPDFEDGANGFSSMTGKVTFGFNVFLGTDANGECIVTKGEIQVVHHPSHTSWHVSIHNGTSAFGETVAAEAFPSPSGRGECVIVGPVTARRDGQRGSELTRMTACDNGEPGSQQPGVSSSGPDAFRWETQDHGDTDLTYLTGGNIQAH